MLGTNITKRSNGKLSINKKLFPITKGQWIIEFTEDLLHIRSMQSDKLIESFTPFQALNGEEVEFLFDGQPDWQISGEALGEYESQLPSGIKSTRFRRFNNVGFAAKDKYGQIVELRYQRYARADSRVTEE